MGHPGALLDKVSGPQRGSKRRSLDSLDSHACAFLVPHGNAFSSGNQRVLGGGGGKEGFKNHLQHVGHAAGEWLADMRSHAFQPNQESHQRLIESVDQELEMLGDSAVHSLPQVRDDFLVKVLRLKDSQKV